MERRDRSLEALRELTYVDTLDAYERAPQLQIWVDTYLIHDNPQENFSLEIKDLKILLELFYKNINFLKEHRTDIKSQLDKGKDIQKFFS